MVLGFNNRKLIKIQTLPNQTKKRIKKQRYSHLIDQISCLSTRWGVQTPPEYTAFGALQAQLSLSNFLESNKKTLRKPKRPENHNQKPKNRLLWRRERSRNEGSTGGEYKGLARVPREGFKRRRRRRRRGRPARRARHEVELRSLAFLSNLTEWSWKRTLFWTFYSSLPQKN